MKNVETSYDEWAQTYDSTDNKTRDFDQKITIDILSQYSFRRVLELGCGTGKNTKWLVQHAEKVVGLDVSEEMLKIARTKIQSENVTFQKGDLNHLWDVEDNYFDLVTSSLTLEHIKELDPIFFQAYQKLQPDGLFFVCEYHPFRQYEGKKARYTSGTGEEIEITAFIHHTTDYVSGALKCGFTLVKMDEWFDENQRDQTPRLISFVFQKK